MTTTNDLMLARDGAQPQPAPIHQLVIAGWTGRDTAAVERHIRELEAIGVARPKRTPIFYRVGASLLTTAGEIEVIGADSSGEVEFVLFNLADGLWVGLGSDHTDRKAETSGVTLSKQMCPKPVASALWRYADVRPHWDHLLLRSFAHVGGTRRLYQEGSVSAMRHPEELIRLYGARGDEMTSGSAMFGGTLAVSGAIEPADEFEIELEDPVRGMRLAHRYRIKQLPVEG
ncbi:MAG: DUF2848 domain-containing protein [Burkholderiaceae bacterium]